MIVYILRKVREENKVNEKRKKEYNVKKKNLNNNNNNNNGYAKQYLRIIKVNKK